ncbi:MAG: hypothetical protein U1F22_00830 [Lysobacterales bacterium]
MPTFTADGDVRQCNFDEAGFTVRSGVEPARLGAATFRAARSVASHDTSQGRVRNRRVELVKR